MNTYAMPIAEYRQRLASAMLRRYPKVAPSVRRAALDAHMETVSEEYAIAVLSA